MNIEAKREKEKELIKTLINLYYAHHENPSEHQDLLEYAIRKIDRCPKMETKSFCSQCEIHCYDTKRRELIRQVMRYSGPRMLFKRPILVLKHFYYQKLGGQHD